MRASASARAALRVARSGAARAVVARVAAAQAAPAMARSGVQARTMADKPAAAAAAAPAGPTSIEMTEDGIAIITMDDPSERVRPAQPAPAGPPPIEPCTECSAAGMSVSRFAAPLARPTKRRAAACGGTTGAPVRRGCAPRNGSPLARLP